MKKLSQYKNRKWLPCAASFVCSLVIGSTCWYSPGIIQRPNKGVIVGTTNNKNDDQPGGHMPAALQQVESEKKTTCVARHRQYISV